MPELITHNLFGLELYDELSALIGASPDERDAFLLGNHGPDPLFFLNALPVGRRYHKLGSLMHRKKPAAVLHWFHEDCVCADCQPPEHARVRRAYALGFMCHYVLDSMVHPLVFSQQAAYCDAGVPGLTRERDWHNVHAVMETDLDEYLLATKLGLTVAEYSPHRKVLRIGNAPLAEISAAYSDVLLDAYGKHVPQSTFATGVRLYRAARLLLDSRRTALGKAIDIARISPKYYLMVDAMTHSGTLREHTPFANDDHVPFPRHNAAGRVVSASFDELYARALDRARAVLPRYAEPSFSFDECERFTAGVNFSGDIATPVFSAVAVAGD